jgi:hypothetical protein
MDSETVTAQQIDNFYNILGAMGFRKPFRLPQMVFFLVGKGYIK